MTSHHENDIQQEPIQGDVLESEKDITKKGLYDTARDILRLGPICDSCFGRQFAMLSTGLTNVERGRSVKTYLGMLADTIGGDEAKAIREELAPNWKPARLKLGITDSNDETCWVCMGTMDASNLERLASEAIDELRFIEYDTFLVGTKMSGLLAENEELLLAEGGSRFAEPLKSELNREVGKIIAMKTGKTADLKEPDIVIHMNLAQKRVDLQVSSVYIYGRYKKLQRGFPQTRWPCRVCHGSGCERCGNTGRMYQESVDELIRDPVIEATRAEDTVFHGSGREDIDARMLGTGRPFVVEAVKPFVRTIDLESLTKDINVFAKDKVEVSDLAIVKRFVVEQLKEAAFDKTYTALIRFGAPVEEEKLKSVLNELVGSVEQRTPTRVSHRRADKVRKRSVHSIELNEYGKTTAKITLRCDSGLYVKELISGDGGRTVPSLASALGIDAEVAELDVIAVGGGLDVQVTWDTKEDQR